jgi:bacterioferritin-associated ferredoxin
LIVCHCHAVSDRTLRRCVREGRISSQDLGECTGAGTGCGGCEALIDEVVRDELSRAEARGAELPGSVRTRLPVVSDDAQAA